MRVEPRFRVGGGDLPASKVGHDFAHGFEGSVGSWWPGWCWRGWCSGGSGEDARDAAEGDLHVFALPRFDEGVELRAGVGVTGVEQRRQYLDLGVQFVGHSSLMGHCGWCPRGAGPRGAGVMPPSFRVGVGGALAVLR